MTLPDRPSPIGKRISLFATCIVDMIYPRTGFGVVDLLEAQGLAVDFPEGQTCCGQPAYNAGYHDEAKQVAKQFLRAFQHAEVLVAPSGSCVAMVRHEYPKLFAGDTDWLPLVERVAARTWEFTEFLVDGLGITDLHLRLETPQTFAFHDACHGLRMLGLRDAARTLLGNVENAAIIELAEADVCCGFGGLFSIKMPDVSGAMLQRKIDNINACDADTIVTGDVSCMTHINGGLSRQGSPKRVRHIVDVLAEGLQGQIAHES